jgi:glycine cleavage system pyridoxal-binding protein P
MLKRTEWRGEKQERQMVVVRKDSHLNTIGVIHTMLVEIGVVVVAIKAGKCREVASITDNVLIPTTLILLPS